MFRIPGVFFEAVPDAGVGGGAVVDPAPPAVEPAAPAEPVAPVEPAQPAPASINYDDPRLQDLIQTQASQIAQQTLQDMVQRAQAQQQQPQQGFDVSQLVDEFGQVIPSALAQMIQQSNERTLAAMQEMVSPLTQTMQEQREAEVVARGEANLEDILADDISRNGDFVRAAGNQPEQVAQAQQADAEARQLVRTVADQLFPEIAQRYGATPRAAEMAMTQAADRVRSLLRTAGQSAQAAQANQLATLAQQPHELGNSSVPGLSRPVVKFGERVTDRYAGPALTQ